MTMPPGWREIPDPEAEVRRLAEKRLDPPGREWGVRHPGGKVTVRIDGHAFPSHAEAEAERAECAEDCDSCDGGTHALVYRDKQPWQPLTAEQEAELRSDIEAAQEAGPHQHRILPSVPPLTPEQVRYLLRECVTVVRPGETLVIRVPATWNPAQVREYAEAVYADVEYLEMPFKALVVTGDELAVAEPGGVPGAA